MDGKFLNSAMGVSAFVFFLSGCATGPSTAITEARPEELLRAACEQGGDSPQVKGSIWAQIETPQLKGQFPATLRATRAGFLALEITDLVGSPQAALKVEGGKPEFKFSPANARRYGKTDPGRIWAGVPYEWAPILFYGGVPCPTFQKDRTLSVVRLGESEIEVREIELKTRTARIYAYSFKDYGAKPWVERMTYRTEGSGPSAHATFEFMDPADPGAYAQKWKATSAQGEILVRWKDRRP